MALFAGIQAVTFDVGGTLLMPHPSVGAVYAATAARHGLMGLEAEMLDRRFGEAWARRGSFQHSRAAWGALVNDVFLGLACPAPTESGLFDDLYAAFARPSAWRICDGALELLEALAAAGFPLGVVSNWDERLRPLLTALGLASLFDVLVVSCETGFSKPSPVMFEVAARGLGLRPAALLHVGDSPEEDVAAARAAGLAAWQVGRPPDGDGTLRELGARLTGAAPAAD